MNFKKIIVKSPKNPNAKKKPYLAVESVEYTLRKYDEALATGDIEKDCKIFDTWEWRDHYGFRRTYGRKGICRGVMSDKRARLGHVVDYPEYRFSRNKRFESLWDVWENDSYAYKRIVSWKGNSKRRHQWIER